MCTRWLRIGVWTTERAHKYGKHVKKQGRSPHLLVRHPKQSALCLRFNFLSCAFLQGGHLRGLLPLLFVSFTHAPKQRTLTLGGGTLRIRWGADAMAWLVAAAERSAGGRRVQLAPGCRQRVEGLGLTRWLRVPIDRG